MIVSVCKGFQKLGNNNSNIQNIINMDKILPRISEAKLKCLYQRVYVCILICVAFEALKNVLY